MQTTTIRCDLRKIMYDREIRTFAEVIRRTGVNRNTIDRKSTRLNSSHTVI